MNTAHSSAKTDPGDKEEILGSMTDAGSDGVCWQVTQKLQADS